MIPHALHCALLAASTHGVDDVRAGPPALHELGDDLGRVLQVAVHDDHRLARGMVQARRNCRLMAEIAAQVDHREVRVRLLQLVYQTGRLVAAAVVHEDDLVRLPQKVQRLDQPAVQLRHVLLLIEQRHNNTDLGCLSAGHSYLGHMAS